MPNLVEIDIRSTDDTGPGIASAIVKINGLRVATAGLAAESAGASAGMAGTAAAAAAASASVYKAGQNFLGAKVGLFGMAANSALAVGGLHLVADAAVEVAAVVVPASIALGTFGLAALPTLEAIRNHLANVNIVASATGAIIPPLTGGFTRMVAAVRPEVLTLFGEGLDLINRKGGAFQTLAVETGNVLDTLGARFVNAVSTGGAFNGIIGQGAHDVALLGNVLGNLGGILGNVLRAVPGYAQYIFQFLGGVTHVAEVMTAGVVPILHWGLALHGALIYGGLAATGIDVLLGGAGKFPGVFGAAANVLGTAAVKMEGLGTWGSKAATSIDSLAGGAGVLAGLPWGWIAVASGGLAVLFFWLNSLKDKTQSYIDSLQNTINIQPTFTGVIDATSTAIAKTNDLLAQTPKVMDTYVTAGRTGYGATKPLTTAFIEATNAAHGFGAESVTENQRLIELTHMFGTTDQALGAFNALHIKASDIGKASAATWKQDETALKGFQLGLRAMADSAGNSTYNLKVLDHLTGDTYLNQVKLNNVLTTFLSISTGFESGINGVIAGMKTFRQEAHASGASLTGIDNASLALQNTFEQTLIPGLQGVIGQMNTAKASTKDMSRFLTTALEPAVDAGALHVGYMRKQIFDLAVEAGYAGPNAIGPLSRFFHQNAGEIIGATTAARGYGKELANLNGLNVTENINAHASWSLVAQAHARAQGPPPPNLGAAAGAYVTGGVAGKDSVLASVMPGELIVPAHMVQSGAADHLRGKIPGFGAGGIVPSYNGSITGVWPWAHNNLSATQTDIYSGIAHAVAQSMQQVLVSGGGGGFGGKGGGAPAGSVAALALQMAQARGWGNLWGAISFVEGHEAGWNMFARNPTSGAYGIAQFINGPGEYYQYGGNPNTAAGQITGFYNYMWDRYHGPIGAAQHEATFGWYDFGGPLKPGPNFMWNGTGKTEWLSPTGGPGQPIVLEVDGSGPVAEFVRMLLRNHIRTRYGGNVQAALGG